MKKGNNGQIGIQQILIGILVLFVVAIIIVALVNFKNNRDFGGSLAEASKSVGNGVVNVMSPLFNNLLGLDRISDTNNQFLMILTFILISIIIVGTLDSVNIFGEEGKGNLINLAIGLIVSIIGVRFMPVDMWGSLTAPSSAFVATILVGAPFAALFILTTKIRFGLGSKLLWLFYLIFMNWLVITSSNNDFLFIYYIFLVLAIPMLFFDSSVRRFWNKEKYKMDVEKMLGSMTIPERAKLRKDIAIWQDVIADSTALATDRASAKKQITKLKAIYGDLSSI